MITPTTEMERMQLQYSLELEKRIAALEAEKDAAMRKLAAAMSEVSYGSFAQIVDLAASALTHWHKIVSNPDLQKYI